MNKTFNILLSFTVLVGCGQGQDSAESAAQVEQSGTVEAAAAPVVSGGPVIDYVWNTTADGMTDEQLADIVARWNARIDAGDCEMVGANVLKPQFETGDYDLIWTLLWPSSEARAAGWADWSANQLDDWNAELDGVLSYKDGNVYTFRPTTGWESNLSSLPVGGTFVLSFSFL